MCFASCFGCKRLFGFNPHSVPSILHNGTREPICATCVARVNPMRRANGLPEIVPAPDAYEAIESSQL